MSSGNFQEKSPKGRSVGSHLLIAGKQRRSGLFTWGLDGYLDHLYFEFILAAEAFTTRRNSWCRIGLLHGFSFLVMFSVCQNYNCMVQYCEEKNHLSCTLATDPIICSSHADFLQDKSSLQKIAGIRQQSTASILAVGNHLPFTQMPSSPNHLVKYLSHLSVEFVVFNKKWRFIQKRRLPKLTFCFTMREISLRTCMQVSLEAFQSISDVWPFATKIVFYISLWAKWAPKKRTGW